MLRRIVGEETFREALRGLQQEHRYGKVGTDDLREALESASGRNLSPYFQQWVFSTSLPRLRYSHRAVGSASEPRTEIDVRPENLPGPVPLELTVVHRTGREVIRVTLPPDGGRWTVATPSRVIRVEINTDRGLLVAP